MTGALEVTSLDSSTTFVTVVKRLSTYGCDPVQDESLHEIVPESLCRIVVCYACGPFDTYVESVLLFHGILSRDGEDCQQCSGYGC